MALGRDDYLHVVMTRFNLATPGRESVLRNRPGWLAERFELFERWCLPTLAAQTRQDFEWIIYFDEGTPPEFRERIEACRTVRPFTPYFTPLFPAEGWPRSIMETFPARPWLLSTRLDNDDGLASDHVERLHAAVEAAPPRTGAFNFTRGFVLDRGALHVLSHPSNAFASRLEPWGPGMRTASGLQHMRLAEHGPVTQIPGPPAWLQVVHGGNVSNKARGRRVRPAAARGRLPASMIAELPEPRAWRLALHNALVAPALALRDALVARLRQR